MTKWAKGYRIIITCYDCGLSFWCKNIGQTVKCNCDQPKILYQDAYRYEINQQEVKISFKKIERVY